MLLLYIFLLIFSLIKYTIGANLQTTTEEWTGRWFPDRSTTTNPLHKLFYHEGGASNQMGDKNTCDDGETNIHVDFPNTDSEFTCLTPRNRIWPDMSLPPVLEFDKIPKAYKAYHVCLNESITYSSLIPTFGPHRQLWPVYGEYHFLPVQRWIHSLEHGGIVALYHPCADLNGIALLLKTVKDCLWRHVTTPWAGLDANRPFAVVAWGVKLRMSVVSPHAIREFIQSHALQGPEDVSYDGQYGAFLLKPSSVVSDEEDSQLCPFPLAHD